MTGPAASSPTVERRMQRQRRKDTKPELALRKALFSMGLRYRVDRAVLPGTRRRADIVFGPVQVAVYVDGCFWHSCPVHRTLPKSNATWWADKLAANERRDRETDQRLTMKGGSSCGSGNTKRRNRQRNGSATSSDHAGRRAICPDAVATAAGLCGRRS